ncbi:MAG TPA: hypothetical protein VF733_02435 [Candidatus Saccharimonadales bacterium]
MAALASISSLAPRDSVTPNVSVRVSRGIEEWDGLVVLGIQQLCPPSRASLVRSLAPVLPL